MQGACTGEGRKEGASCEVKGVEREEGREATETE